MGVKLDTKLNFKGQVDYAASKAQGALAKISKLLRESGGVRTKIGAILYKAFIRPHLEFSYPAWCTTGSIESLERVHHMALVKVTGCLNNTATETLEVLSGIPPLNVRFTEVLAQEGVRLCQKKEDNPLKKLITSDLPPPGAGVSLKPSHLIKKALRQTSRQLDVTLVEEEPTQKVQNLFSSTLDKKLIAWHGLGNSRTRTQEQIKHAKALTTNFLIDLGDTAIAFTDGSALKNPGPCGAGATIYPIGIDCQPILLQRPVSPYSTSYHGELQAIDLVLSHLLASPLFPSKTVTLLTDCQSALQTVCNNRDPNSHHTLCSDIRTKTGQLSEEGWTLQIGWVAGHADLAGNELADQQAKEAAHSAKSMPPQQNRLSVSEVKSEIRKQTNNIWQRQWTNSNKGRFTHSLFPHVNHRPINSNTKYRKSDKLMNRIRSGHAMTSEYKHRIKLPGQDSPLCECGGGTGDVEHVLFHCRSHSNARLAMIESIELLYHRENVPPHLRKMDLSTLLGAKEHLPHSVCTKIDSAVARFLAIAAPKI